MELAGLEPATSWVRSTHSLAQKMPLLQRFSLERLECRNIPRNIRAAVLHYVNAEDSPPGGRSDHLVGAGSCVVCERFAAQAETFSRTNLMISGRLRALPLSPSTAQGSSPN